ncbi:MAG: DUF3343 domain-containing protein [Oscillospiraceae bacterium]|nr:DUF3343 domain-containing protein [Oscillospiraceae bacterium]
MDTFYIGMNSVTYAHKANTLLNLKGIKCRVVRSPEHSCGYGIYVTASSRDEIIRILSEGGVKLSGVK